MAMSSSEVKVTCKRCNRQAKAGEFVLDSVYKMMVCPLCVKERKAKSVMSPKPAQKQEQPKPEEKKPAGWDAEDELLERLQRQKQQKAGPAVEKIDSEKVRYGCIRCKYKFVYNIKTRTPSSCPYCGAPVMTSFLR